LKTPSVQDLRFFQEALSTYLKLDGETREALFQGLREHIQHEWGDSLQLSYISAFHIARKF